MFFNSDVDHEWYSGDKKKKRIYRITENYIFSTLKQISVEDSF